MRIFNLFLSFFSIFLFMLNELGTAQSFPFRAVSIGSKLPNVTVFTLDGKGEVLSKYSKDILVIAFFGADSKMKEEHSKTLLKGLVRIYKEFKERGVNVVGIDTQGDPEDVIKGIVDECDISFPIFVDSDKNAYEVFGVFVMPAVVVSKGGRIVYGFGYTYDIVAKLRENLLVLLGEKTEEEAFSELHPKTAKIPQKRKEAQRLLNLAKSMREKGMEEEALKSLKEASAINDSLGEVHIELSEIYLNKGEVSEAEKELKKRYGTLSRFFKRGNSSSKIERY